MMTDYISFWIVSFFFFQCKKQKEKKRRPIAKDNLIAYSYSVFKKANNIIVPTGVN